MNKITSIRIDSELLDKIKVYSEIENTSQTDFINDLLSDALEKYFLQRSGGAVLTLPNPQKYIIDDLEAKEALAILNVAADSIHQLDVNLPIPLYPILAFFEQRLLYELPEDVERFKQNLILDCTQCDKIAKENTNSVRKEE